MLPDPIVAGTLGLCLAAFFGASAHNIVSGLRERGSGRSYAKVESPRNILTVLFFVEAISFTCLALTGSNQVLHAPPLQLRFGYESWVQLLGIIFLGVGVFVFLWSVVARGRYSVSWEMPEDHRLVTWGPYRLVRHPSYLGYFLMFIGLFFTWLNLVAVIPLVAIPEYVVVVGQEEELLLSQFGEEYQRYQETTGRFIPRLRKR